MIRLILAAMVAVPLFCMLKPIPAGVFSFMLLVGIGEATAGMGRLRRG